MRPTDNTRRFLNPDSARFIQLHYLTSGYFTNRNEDSTLKTLQFGGAVRSRVSSQAEKAVLRMCDDPEVGLASILDAKGKPIAQTRPSRGHFERIIERMADQGGAPQMKSRIVSAVYDMLVGTKAPEAKADKKLDLAQKRLAKAQEAEVAAAEAVDKAPDAKARKKAESEHAKATTAVQRAHLALRDAGGDAEVDEDSSAAEQQPEEGTKQVLWLSDHEIDLLHELSVDALGRLRDGGAESPHKAAKEAIAAWNSKSGDSFRTLQLGCGIGAAIFGRQTFGGGLLQASLSAVGFAHRFTVHAQKLQHDTFTTMDEFARSEGRMGAGHFGELPLAWGLSYGYAWIDTHLLIENIERTMCKSEIAAEVVRRLIMMIARVSTRVRQGSVASKNFSKLLLVEVGSDQPASFSDAFENPVTTGPEREDIFLNTFDQLAAYVKSNDGAHPTGNARAMTIVDPTGKNKLVDVIPTSMDDLSLAVWAVDQANGHTHARANGHAKPPTPASAATHAVAE